MCHITILLLLSTVAALNAQSLQYPLSQQSTQQSVYNPWAAQAQTPAQSWSYPPPPPASWASTTPVKSWSPSPPSSWGTYPPPAPSPGTSAFYAPQSPSYTAPSPSGYKAPTAPTYGGQGTVDNRLAGWNTFGSETFSVVPGVDVFQGNSLVVTNADYAGQLRGTVCTASSSSSALWTVLINPFAVPPVNGVATTIATGNVFTTYCGKTGLIYTTKIALGGTTFIPPGTAPVSIFPAAAGSTFCVDTPATVFVNPLGVLVGFDRFSVSTSPHTENVGFFFIPTGSGNPTPFGNTALSTPPSTIQYGPTATTYADSSGMTHILVAIVLYGGQMQYFDYTVSPTANIGTTQTGLQGMQFTSSSLVCRTPPVAVSLGTSAQIYCLGRSPYPGCLLVSNIQNGGEVSAEYYTDSTAYLPSRFSAAYVYPNVNIVARSDLGVLYTRALDSTKWAQLYN